MNKQKKARLTPMMQQYMKLKEENKDSLLFFRLGDFYELFFEDAITASRELEITLTARDCGLEEKAPMCGVPFHSVDGYLYRLIEKGYKVAICEQLTDPKDSVGTIVERGVVRIVTPGTLTDDALLQSDKNNYILSIYRGTDNWGAAYADISTGEFVLTDLSKKGLLGINDEIARIKPAEIIVNEIFKNNYDESYQKISKSIYINEYAKWAFEFGTAEKNLCDHLKVNSLRGFGCEDMPAGVCAAGALLAYLNETQCNSLPQINKIRTYRYEDNMILDASTRRNLELTQTLRGGKTKKGTLLGLLDSTSTSMGARLLRSWVDQPLYNVDEIKKRQGAVAELMEKLMVRESLREKLRQVYDMERLAGKISGSSFNARDALALACSMSILPDIHKELNQCESMAIKKINQEMDLLEDIQELISRSIALEAPVSIRDGGIIREGYNEEIDHLRNAGQRGRIWLEELEGKERQSTGIKNLKVGYNRIFGYYIEVTKSYLEKVPYHYQRKQTLANAERYITQELKELEKQILGAEEKYIVLEYHVFCEIQTILKSHIERIQQTAHQLANLDTLQSLASIAIDHNYVCPQIYNGYEIDISEGRHPVVELSQNDRFVSNDTTLNEDSRLLIITGPNMAGKSTYMRQIALICLMAHIGSFVPAIQAKIPLIDRIFTRVGAADDLASGQSTFMVEMSETANILQNASKNSLILLDEIGRGTSTFDGLSIAWAVCEYIANPIVCGAKTLFATHYHELSELEGILSGVVNYRITAKEIGDQIVFLRKIVRGGTDKSFGIQVAQLAGLPQTVINRAKKLLLRLEEADLNHPKNGEMIQNSLNLEMINAEESEEVIKGRALFEAIRKIDVDVLSPREALNLLYSLKEIIKN